MSAMCNSDWVWLKHCYSEKIAYKFSEENRNNIFLISGNNNNKIQQE